MGDVKKERIESLLKEVVSEALAELSNPLLRGLCVSHVSCAKGKSDAKIFIESSGLDANERAQILRELNRASGVLKEHILHATEWFKAPNLTFVMDDSLQSVKNLESIFEQIHREREKK